MYSEGQQKLLKEGRRQPQCLSYKSYKEKIEIESTLYSINVVTSFFVDGNDLSTTLKGCNKENDLN